MRRGDLGPELVLENGDVRLVFVVRRLLLDAACRRSRATLHRSDVLVAIAELVESVDVLDQLVREALGVERELVELAVQVAAHREVERNEIAHLAPQPERDHLAHVARVGELADERRLADLLDRLARHYVLHRERMRLGEPETVALLREARGGVAAEVDPHIVIVVRGRIIIDGDTCVIWNKREILVFGVLVHLRNVGLAREHVPCRERRAVEFARLHDRAVPFVAVILVVEARGSPLHAFAVGDENLPLHQVAGSREVTRRNRRRILVSPVGNRRLRSKVYFVRHERRIIEVLAVYELDGLDLVGCTRSERAVGIHNAVYRERHRVVRTRNGRRRRDGELIGVSRLSLASLLVERTDIRTDADKTRCRRVLRTTRRCRTHPTTSALSFGRIAHDNRPPFRQVTRNDNRVNNIRDVAAWGVVETHVR